jgi:hypothetical protein
MKRLIFQNKYGGGDLNNLPKGYKGRGDLGFFYLSPTLLQSVPSMVALARV